MNCANKIRHSVARVATALVLGSIAAGAPNSYAGFVFTPIAGDGVSGVLADQRTNTSASLNDFGNVAMGAALTSTFTAGFYLTNGIGAPTSILALNFPPPTGSSDPPRLGSFWGGLGGVLSLDNTGQITFVNRSLYFGSVGNATSAIYSTAAPYLNATAESGAFTVGLPNRIDTNSSGQGVFWISGAGADALVRINGDGTTAVLPTPANFNGISSQAPQILENGDIYVIGNNLATSEKQILKFAAGQTTSTAALSLPNTAGLTTFGVNNLGNLVAVTNNSVTGGNGQSTQLTLVPNGGLLTAVAGSVVAVGAGLTYSNVSISDLGEISAARVGSGGSEILYGEPMVRVIGEGDAFQGGTITSVQAIYQASGGMNQPGQLLARVDYDPIPGLPGPLSSTLVRIDPEGTTPQNPWRPTPCVGNVNRFCFTRPVIGRSSSTGTRVVTPRYYDPVYAAGYEYISEGNPFDTLEIPFDYGDGVFDLYLYGMGGYYDSGYDVLSSQTFDLVSTFGTGVLRFALFGIEQSAQVDPSDPLGFVTGLTFFNDGEARFAMIPNVDGPPTNGGVPEPASLALIGIGLAGLGFSRRKQ